MKVLEPSMTHSSPSSRAVVLGLSASEPPCGSVRQMDADDVPAMSGTRYLRFCPSVPRLIRWRAIRLMFTKSVASRPASTRAVSSATMARVIRLPPPPPYSSGAKQPSSPWSPISLSSSAGGRPARSMSGTIGRTCVSMNRRTTVWNSRSSSVSSEWATEAFTIFFSSG